MFPFKDYKVVQVNVSGQNANQNVTIYTTEYPCFLFVEVRNGDLPGFKGDKRAYFDIEYTGDRDYLVRTYLFGDHTDEGTPINEAAKGGTIVGYCPRSGVNVRFTTGDDDYSGVVRVHVMRLPSI